MKKIVCVSVLLSVIIVSCSSLARYEYRYRVFYGIEEASVDRPAPGKDAETIYPLAGLNRAMDQLSQEGFRLYESERIEGGNNYIFKFRRAVRRGEVEVKIADIDGVYKLADEQGGEKILAVIQRNEKNYEVVELKETGGNYNAALSGDGLMFHTPDGLARLQFSKDKREVICLIEVAEEGKKRSIKLEGGRY